MELKNRQESILRGIVEEFIRTGKPVGSKFILENCEMDCSAATIRQEMAVLEQIGMLDKLHTSGGRVPSNEGYRYYVDNLMSNSNGLEIKKMFDQREVDIKDILNRAASILSETTGLSAVLVTENEDECLQAVNLTKLNEKTAVAIIITNKGSVSNKIFTVNTKRQLNELEIAINLFNERLKNTPLNMIEQKAKIIKPILEKQIKEHELIFKAMVNEFLRMLARKRKIIGGSNLVRSENFTQEQLAIVLDAIENHSSFEKFAKAQEKESQILIGDETGLGVDDVSIIQHEINARGTNAKIALVGHKRMDYKRINDVMDAMFREIEEMIEE